MTWVAVAVGVVGAGASYLGSKKQADASKKGAALQMDQFNTLNKQQQPYIQSGYGAMGKLSTLLGIGARPRVGGTVSMPPAGITVNNGPAGPGVRIPPRLMVSNDAPVGAPSGAAGNFGIPQGAGNLNLRRILTMRAQNGDTEAARMLGNV